MFKSLALLYALGLVYLVTRTVSQTPAPECPSNASHCVLPDCRCFSTNTPGNNNRTNTPQIVFLTFDDAINSINYPFYEEHLFGRKNPNNADISATFFITHEYNDYNRTHDLYRRGHDIALHSITHQTNPQYWRELSEAGWKSEFVDQRAQVARFANIPENQIKGMRAAFLQIGGDRMYKALTDNRFEWECSRPTRNYRPNLWPYTADYASEQDCAVDPCPIGRYPGFWTVPLVDLLGGDLFPCAMFDTCLPTPNTTAEVLNLLKTNFLDHYEGNRAPFGVFTHAAFFLGEGTSAGRQTGFSQFLDYLDTLPDVYIVSISKALDWMRNPVPLAQIANITSWRPTNPIANACPNPINCRFIGNQTPHAGGAERYMMSCQPCTPMYPWLNNPLGAAV